MFKKTCMFLLILMLGSVAVASADWFLALESNPAAGAETTGRTITIGMADTAEIGEELPPIGPGAYYYDTRLTGANLGEGTLSFIDTMLTEATFTITNKVHASEDEGSLSWSGSLLSPQYDYVLKYPDGNMIKYLNMSTADSVSFAPVLASDVYTYDLKIMVEAKTDTGGTPPTIVTESIPGTWGKMLYSFDMKYSDPDDGDPLSFEVVEGPYWLNLTDDGDLDAWVPNPSSGSDKTYNITIKVTDSYGNNAYKDFSMTVKYNDNRPPDIETVRLPDAMTGTAYSVKIEVDDFRTDDLTYKLFGRKPPWANISNSGYLYGTPAIADSGSNVEIKISVTDQLGYGDTLVTTIDVLDYLSHQNSDKSNDISGIDEAPDEFAVSGAFPNPFNPETTIQYQLPADAHVNLVVYDVLGRKVAVLADRQMGAGYHSVVWDGRDSSGNLLASGTYIYRLQAGENTANGKMMFVR